MLLAFRRESYLWGIESKKVVKMLSADFLTACLPPGLDKSSWEPWKGWKWQEISSRLLRVSSLYFIVICNHYKVNVLAIADVEHQNSQMCLSSELHNGSWDLSFLLLQCQVHFPPNHVPPHSAAI